MLQIFFVESVTGLREKPLAVLLGEQRPAVEAIDENLVAVRLVLHEEMPRHADAVHRKPQPFPDEQIHDGQTDRDAGPPVDHAVQIAVLDLVVVLGVAFESLLGEEIPVERLDRLLAGGPGADAVPHLLRHFIEQPGIDPDVERGVGVAGDQKRPLLQIHALIGRGRQFDELVFQLPAADLLEHRRDAFRHFRLFDFRFLEERDGRGTDIDELAADRLDDLLVLVGKQSNEGSDLALVHEHAGTPEQAHQPIARRNALAPP